MEVFSYDEPAYFDATDFSVTKDDSANYGTGFVAGRGNLTTVNEYDPQTGKLAYAHADEVRQDRHDNRGDRRGQQHDAVILRGQFPAGPGSGANTRALDESQRPGQLLEQGSKYDWYTGNVLESYHIAGTSGTGAHENVTTYGYDAFDRPIPPPVLMRMTTTTYWDNWLAAEPIRRSIGKTRDVAYSDGAPG